MNRIEKLISELCPKGVPYVTLGSIAQVANRGVDKVEKPDEEEVFLLNYMDVHRNRELTPECVPNKTTASVNQIRDCDLRVGDIIITPTSETRDDLAHAAVVILPLPKTVYSYHVMRLRILDKEVADSKYLAYQFRSRQLQSQILSASNGITRFGLTKSKWESLRIQIPPLEIQKEVVRILDTFMELEDELEAELKSRKTQYAFFRKSLLDCDRQTSKSYKLKDVCLKISSGGTPSRTRADFFGGSIPWVRTQEVDFKEIWSTELNITDLALRNSSARWVPANTVILAMYGATAGKSAITKIPVTTNQACCNLEVDPELCLPEYLFHWLMANYLDIKSLGQGTQSNLNAGMVRNLEIRLPDLEEQSRIITALNKFDALTKDMQVGIPAEIRSRRQQFEYYRNNLLTFKVLVAA